MTTYGTYLVLLIKPQMCSCLKRMLTGHYLALHFQSKGHKILLFSGGKGERNSRVYNSAGRRGRKSWQEEEQTGCRQQGCPKAGKEERKSPPVHHTTFLGSTTRTPECRVLHPGPFFLLPQSQSQYQYQYQSKPHSPPRPEPRKYFSLTSFEPYHYQWQASERRLRRSGRNRRLLRLPARSRRARPWVLAAPSSPSAGGLPTSNRQCSVRRLPHIATAPSPRILRVFSLSSPHSPGAPRLILLLLGAAAARHFGAGSSVLIFLPLRFFRGFCCSFSLA
jgi:hypothetical protein